MAKRETSVEERIRRGAAAWKIVRDEDRWAEWEPVCDSLALLSSKAMKLAATNQPKGKQYALHFAALLRDHELHDVPKTTRAAAIHCGHHLRLIADHRAVLKKGDPETYLRMNAPQVTWAIIKPLTLTAAEKAEADRKKQQREADKTAKAATAIDLTEMDGEGIAELLITMVEKPDCKTVMERLIAFLAPGFVLLMGTERAHELGRILINEFKLSNTAAYELIDELRRHYAPPSQDPDPETPEPVAAPEPEPELPEPAPEPVVTPEPAPEPASPPPVKSVRPALMLVPAPEPSI